MKSYCAFGVLASGLAFCGWAQQGAPTQWVIRGEISQERGTLPNDLIVEAYDLEHHLRVDSAMAASNGSFEFRNLGVGHYWIRVLNSRDDVICEELAAIRQGEPLFLRVPGRDVTRPTSAVVSVNSLHSVPRKAAKEFRRSQTAFEAGQIRESIEHLEKAIQLHPSFMEAHNNLGARYMALQKYDQAVAEFQKTVALDPMSAKGYLNLSVALRALRQYAEAELAARRALQLDSHSVAARYELGQVLAAQGKDAPEALENLRKATEQYPKARLMIARILVLQGAIDEAAVELRKYLKSGDVQRKRQAESWLAQLQR